jgi:hypothetical protein
MGKTSELKIESRCQINLWERCGEKQSVVANERDGYMNRREDVDCVTQNRPEGQRHCRLEGWRFDLNLKEMILLRRNKPQLVRCQPRQSEVVEETQTL